MRLANTIATFAATLGSTLQKCSLWQLASTVNETAHTRMTLAMKAFQAEAESVEEALKE